jgi:hypothetical protein
MTTTYRQTPIATSVHLDGDNPIFGESATHICLEDEAGGCAFIVLKQCHDLIEKGEVRVDLEELELIAKVAKEMVEEYDKVLKSQDERGRAAGEGF